MHVYYLYLSVKTSCLCCCDSHWTVLSGKIRTHYLTLENAFVGQVLTEQSKSDITRSVWCMCVAHCLTGLTGLGTCSVTSLLAGSLWMGTAVMQGSTASCRLFNHIQKGLRQNHIHEGLIWGEIIVSKHNKNNIFKTFQSYTTNTPETQQCFRLNLNHLLKSLFHLFCFT